MTEQANTNRLAEAFHTAFGAAYIAAARQRYPRFVTQLPFHAQDVHIIHGGNRWWHILCIAGQLHGDVRMGPVGRFTLQFVDTNTHPDLASLPDQSGPRKEEFRLAMGARGYIYHEAFTPPWPSSESALAGVATALAERLVHEHASGLLELEALRSRVSGLRNGHQVLHDLDEALACLWAERYRAGTVTMCSAAESAIVGRLEDLGHPIRQEERARVWGHEHHSFVVMLAEIYRRGAITSKTRDALELLSGIRRGIEHVRPDATWQDDADFAWATLQLLLNDLLRQRGS